MEKQIYEDKLEINERYMKDRMGVEVGDVGVDGKHEIRNYLRNQLQ